MSDPAVSWAADGVVVIGSGQSAVVNPTSPGVVGLNGSSTVNYANPIDSLNNPANAAELQNCGDTGCSISFQIENGSSKRLELAVDNGSNLAEFWVMRPDRSVEPRRPIGAYGAQTFNDGDPITHFTQNADQRVTLLARVSDRPIFGLSYSLHIALTPAAQALNSGNSKDWLAAL